MSFAEKDERLEGIIKALPQGGLDATYMPYPRKATINTFVDGQDAKQINAWSHCDGRDNRKVKGYFKNGDGVDIMGKDGDYVEIRGIGYKWNADLQKEIPNEKVRGWCHRLFLNDTEKAPD